MMYKSEWVEYKIEEWLSHCQEHTDGRADGVSLLKFEGHGERVNIRHGDMVSQKTKSKV